jgi:hypothetical protein
MKIRVFFVIAFFVVTATARAQVNIKVDSTTKFQTIEGWGHGGGVFSSLNYSIGQAIGDTINHQMLDFLIDDLGLTGSRVWEIGPRPDGTGIDNGDCDSIDWTKFYAPTLDQRVADYTVYFKNRVESNGFKTSFYSSPTYSTAATSLKPWVLNHPGERAQQIWAGALWWKNNYGIDIKYDVIANEPNGVFTTQILTEDTKALGPRLLQLGLATRTQYAEAIAPQTDWNFITPVQNDSDLWKYVGRISYHNYGTADPYRTYLRDFAKSKGITTAQTEMGNPTLDDLYSDLTLGGVSYWEIAFSGSNTLVPTGGNTGFTLSNTYIRLRQLMHYVRPGAVRVLATSSDSLVRVLSFVRNKAVTTVIINGGTTRAVTLSGLPAGSYGRSQASPGVNAFTESGVQTVDGSGSITLQNVGGGSVITTLYPYSGKKHAPTIMTYFATPGYLVAPTASTVLTVKASDPELDPLTYTWSVDSQPGGANALIATTSVASTAVNGLSVAGTYIFNISVSDGSNVSSKKIYILVYASNPPPVLGQAGFRIAPPYGLVFTDPGDTTHANIELPTSSVTVQVGVGDLANSSFNGRGKWTLVSQPNGANAFLDTTIYIYVSIRAQASKMTVPGDYVFHVSVTNPGHPDLTAQVICRVHPASAGPVINSITATPANLTLPSSATELTGATSDPGGQLLRHWWAIKSSPAGSSPTFDHQGCAISSVSGLTVVGNYVFTLRAFDDLHMTTKDFTVVVKPSSGVEVSTLAPGRDITAYPNPITSELTLNASNADDRLTRIVVMNALGQVLLDQHITEPGLQTATLPFEKFTSGVYFLTIQSKSKTQSMKVVKQ